MSQARNPVAPERILVLQTAFLGDVVLTIPLLRELCRVHPQAKLSVVTTEVGSGLLGGLPEVHSCLVLDKRWDRRGGASCRRLLGTLRRERFDAVVAAHRSFRSGLIARLSGASLRIGFAGAPGFWAYNRRVSWVAGRHAVRRYLDLAGPLGGDPSGADPSARLTAQPQQQRSIENLLAKHGVATDAELLCVAPGSVWATKRWVPEGFARVVAGAGPRGLVPVLIGVEGEERLCRQVARLSGRPVPVLAGRTSVAELVALVARARLVVANDSGAAHVASAVGTPVVSIFGSTVPELGYAAYGAATRVVEQPGLGCRPCGRHGSHSCPLGHFRCMRELSATRVLQAVDGLLRATGQAARPALQRVVPG